MSQPVRTETRGEIGLLVADHPPVNALSAAVRKGLMEGIEALEADDAVRAIVVHCEGKTFFAGADIREFDKPVQNPPLPAVIDRIEACSKPVVAAIHGTALGGGFEVALGCHFRIANQSARVGLPEVKLGLLPGAGGTQRLPRLIGAVPAFEFIVAGDPIPAGRAVKLGVIDEIVDGDLLDAAIARARHAAESNEPLRRVSRLSGPWDDAEKEAEKLDEAAAPVLAKKHGFPSIAAIHESIRNAITSTYEAGLKRDREFFLELKEGYQSQAQRYLFFAERTAMKIDDMPDDTRARNVESAAVLGSGTMGGGIAMCFANAGIPVTLIDPDPDALERGVGTIRSNYERSAKRAGREAAWVEERMARINPVTEMAGATDADMVVEAVFEDMELKKRVFGELDGICKAEAVLASNTSTLDVNEIAASTGRPESVVGMHFFSPANVMRLLEVVRAERTGFETLKTAIETGRRIGKLPVTVGVCYGFVGNRMLHQRGGQVERLLLEGASPEQIDSAMTQFGFAMGPCAVGDLAGLDIGWRARKHSGRTAPVADALCERGRFGQKTGMGYYRYEEGSRKPIPDPEVDVLIQEIAAEKGVERGHVGDEEIFERLVFPLVNEGARILEEGIAARASDIDLIWVNGYGWPAFEGGPMFLANRLGPDHVAERLSHHAEKTGDESLEPAPLLKRLAKEGGKFA